MAGGGAEESAERCCAQRRELSPIDRNFLGVMAIDDGEPDDSADDDSGGGDDGDGNKPDGQCPAHPRCNQEDADDSEESNDETGPSTTEGSPAPTTTTAPLADYCTEWSSFELPQHDSHWDVPIDVKCGF